MARQPKKLESSLQFHNYRVNRVVFESNESFTEGTVNVDFSINREVAIELPNASVTLSIDVFKDAKEKNYPFSMSLSITGYFTIEGESEETAQKLAEMNTVAILYPYIRSIVTTYTAQANVSPLILPTINVIRMFEEGEAE